MEQDVRLWEILDGDDLREVKKAKLDLEDRIENWLEKDISIVSDDLLVIGRQVGTDFGGAIDILCLDRNGDAVILELKRDRTPREVTAQTLDYGSWAQDLSNERITEIADRYLADEGSLEEAFTRRFGEELPEFLNEHHTMLVIASEIDSSSERIIRYLSDSYGVGINAVTFQYLRDEAGKEFLARVFLIEPSQVEYSTRTKVPSKRRPRLTYEELQEIARRNGVGEVYARLVEALNRFFDGRGTTGSSIAFVAVMEGSRRTIFSLLPGESDTGQGLCFQLYIDRLSEYLDASRDDVARILPADWEDREVWKGGPVAGFFRSGDEAERFLAGLSGLKQSAF